MLHPDSAWPMPDWSLLDDRRGQLPAFPLHHLPSSWQAWLLRASRGAGVGPDLVFPHILSAASSLVGSARRVQASTSWSEPILLWTAVVAHSGVGKTPGLNVMRRALSIVEHERQERLSVVDSSTTQLANLISEYPRGFMCIRDELAGLFSKLHDGDREFWLEAWTGGPYSRDRANQPPIAIPSLRVALTGGLQPDKLVRTFRGDDDGLHTRFLFAWPEEPAYAPLSDQIGEVDPELCAVFRRLAAISEPIRIVPLAALARERFEQFRAGHVTARQELEGRERELWAKAPAQLLRLAGVLAFLECAAGTQLKSQPTVRGWTVITRYEADEPQEIRLGTMQTAINLWLDYFWPHGQAAIRLMGRKDHDRNARLALRWMRSIGATTVSIEDIRVQALSRRLRAVEISELLDRLRAAGWVREAPTDRQGPGRPCRRWEVHPGL